jgi:hypothetical protein
MFGARAGRSLMTLQQAFTLVRDKYTDEERGITSGIAVERYRRACQEYPAMMITAHYQWANEVGRTSELEATSRAS